MVVLSAAISTKSGKVLVARQFIEMSRSRVEGLVNSFAKLITGDRQHTTIDTEEVRFVYQPLDDLYMVLITSKRSNILQDIDTLHLFSRVVEDLCRGSLTEKEIGKHAFDLLFAFDEIISLGYRENVNLPQIKIISEMESAEERIQDMIAKNKEMEAKEESKRKMKLLEMQKREMARGSAMSSGSSLNVGPVSVSLPGFVGAAAASALTSLGGISFANQFIGNPGVGRPGGHQAYQPIVEQQLMAAGGQGGTSISPYQTGTPSRAKGMQLGRRPEFGLPSEDQPLNPPTGMGQVQSHVPGVPPVPELPMGISSTEQTTLGESSPPEFPDHERKPVHISLNEKMSMKANHDGGLELFEVKGECLVRILDLSPERSRLKLQMKIPQGLDIQFKTHPNVDKNSFLSSSVIQLKDTSRAFPPNQSLGVLKWRWTSQDEGQVPLMVNCWPSLTGSGSVEVNVEYDLQIKHMELTKVEIEIPIPYTNTQAPAPVVSSVDGHYAYDQRKHALVWKIPVVDRSHPSGTLDFSVQGGSSVEGSKSFFPVSVSFASHQLRHPGLEVEAVSDVPTDEKVDFSQGILCASTSYQFC